MLNLGKFRVGDRVVYPSHGVGEIIGEETQSIGGLELRVFIISLIKENMLLRVPVKRATSAGLRLLSSLDIMHGIFSILQSKSKKTRGMWSKRAQEYELKINSGDVNSLAEVVRDLHRSTEDTDRSYSERIIYESALNRLAGELSMVKDISLETALSMLLESLQEKECAA